MVSVRNKYGFWSLMYMGFLIFILVLYIFNIIPKFGPDKLGTREYLSVVAIVFVIIQYRKIPKLYGKLIVANWAMAFISIITMLVNSTTDFWYVQFAIRNVLYLNGAVFIALIFPQKWSFELYLKLIIGAILVNDIIAAAAFFIPSIMNMLVSIQNLDSLRTEKTIEFAVRMIGLGSGSYFPGGVINGMGIITAFYMMTQKKLGTLSGGIIIFFMTIIGLFIARTVIVGLIVGLLFYVKEVKLSGIVNSLILGILFLLVLFSSGLLDGVNTHHAFEIFSLSGINESRSLESMKGMYNVDMDTYTWIIGDGLSKLNGAYYKETDIGYLRNILYFGLTGTIFGYFYYELIVLKSLAKVSKSLKLFAIFMGIDLLILNFKGLPDFNFYIFLIISYFLIHKKGNVKNENSSCYLGSRNRWGSTSAV